MTGIYGRLLVSAPVDKQAALSTAKGIEWDSNRKHSPVLRRWLEKPTDLLQKPSRAKTFDNLIGMKLGRFTVVGFLGKLNPKKKSLWLVRCTCGAFEARTTPAVKTPNDRDACVECLYLEQVKRGNGNAKKEQAE